MSELSFCRAPILGSLHRPGKLLDALHGGPPLHAESRLYGTWHRMYRPALALKAVRNMGPVRHALAQRAIAGSMEVHAPFGKP